EAGATKIRVPLQVDLATDPATWPAGLYTVAVVVSRGDKLWTSNEMPLSLAPRIVQIDPNPAPRDATQTVTLKVTCSPEVQPEQRAVLLLNPTAQSHQQNNLAFGGQEIPAEPHTTQTNTLTFAIRAASPGDFFVRLRVDGTDSLLVDATSTSPGF